MTLIIVLLFVTAISGELNPCVSIERMRFCVKNFLSEYRYCLNGVRSSGCFKEICFSNEICVKSTSTTVTTSIKINKAAVKTNKQSK